MKSPFSSTAGAVKQTEADPGNQLREVKMHIRLFWLFVLITLAQACGPAETEPIATDEATTVSEDDFIGRWDVTVQANGHSYPSWFEITRGNGGITGRFVGRVGSARPIETIEVKGSELYFSLPPQYENYDDNMWFRGELDNGVIKGTTISEEKTESSWTAVRAPDLRVEGEPEWGEPIQLIQPNLEGWKPRNPDQPNNWVVENGELRNTERGTDLVTEQEFMDFKLSLEFRYPEKSNSGVYLRGRYELQIQDDFGKEPDSLFIGGVYGFIDPVVNAARKAGEWQTYEVTLVGRTLTVVLNGTTVIDQEEIPGITGGALDSNEGEPGPLMLQGDHGPISFRNIVLTPAL